MRDADEASRHYRTVARAIDFLRRHARHQPTLEEVAAAAHMSPFHLQRLFTEWAGISPKRFLQYLTKEYARERLAASADTLSAALDAGLSGTGRLHELMVSCEAMTPAEVRAAGRGLAIGHGLGPTPFGEALVAWTPRGVCHFAFLVEPATATVDEFLRRWPEADHRRDDDAARALLAHIFTATPARGTLHLVLRGTNFQIKVWEALIRTAPGELLSYGQLASRLGMPRAARAVGGAVAANAIGLLIPCHRVIRESGEVGDYRWGPSRKLALLGWEAARR